MSSGIHCQHGMSACNDDMHVLLVCAIMLRPHSVTNFLQLIDVRPIGGMQVLYSFYLAARPAQEKLAMLYSSHSESLHVCYASIFTAAMLAVVEI